MEKDKISVIIPVYKVEKYLSQCVESVIKQSYKNLEIILVDDGSPDNCPKMCDEWAKKDSRIKVIHKQNGGLSDARNAGIDVATGDYLSFVDSDDSLNIGCFEKMVRWAQGLDADVVIGGIELVYENATVKKKNNALQKSSAQVFRGEQVKNLIYSMSIPFLMTAWAKLYKKELFNSLKFPVGKLHEDEFVYYKVLASSQVVAIIPDTVYYYLQRSTSIMHTKTEKNGLDILEAYKQKFDFIKDKYPEDEQINLDLYLMELRCVYPGYIKSKNIASMIDKEFCLNYKSLKKKGIKNFLFKNLRWVYMLLYNIKNQKHTRRRV